MPVSSETCDNTYKSPFKYSCDDTVESHRAFAEQKCASDSKDFYHELRANKHTLNFASRLRNTEHSNQIASMVPVPCDNPKTNTLDSDASSVYVPNRRSTIPLPALALTSGAMVRSPRANELDRKDATPPRKPC